MFSFCSFGVKPCSSEPSGELIISYCRIRDQSSSAAEHDRRDVNGLVDVGEKDRAKADFANLSPNKLAECGDATDRLD